MHSTKVKSQVYFAKDHLEFGFQSRHQRWDNQSSHVYWVWVSPGIHSWGATPAWDHQLCILLGWQRRLLEEECQITTWDWAVDLIHPSRHSTRGREEENKKIWLSLMWYHQTKMFQNFWSCFISKTAFQALYVEWLTTNYKGTKPLYLGI